MGEGKRRRRNPPIYCTPIYEPIIYNLPVYLLFSYPSRVLTIAVLTG
jgi:hypothetical protein